jgi:hypothetical protein
MLRGRGLLRGIFDKETRRKRLAVLGAAMELRARLGLGERRDEFGSGGPVWRGIEGALKGQDGVDPKFETLRNRASTSVWAVIRP